MLATKKRSCWAWLGAFAVCLGGCEKSSPGPTEPASTSAQGSTGAAGPAITIESFSTPESALFDPTTDVILVSNINGSPAAKDDNGFISKLTGEGEITALKWIDGSREDVTLNAPKGMALLGGTLYVADIDAVRMFDAATGAPKGEKVIEGATFLNDVAAFGGDAVVVSDSGESSSAIWRLATDGGVTSLASGPELGRPNGLAAQGDKLWCVTMGSGELVRIADGKRAEAHKLPAGQLDGLVVLDDGTFLVSSWEAKAVYRGSPDGPFTVVGTASPAPADIGYDPKRKRLLMPNFDRALIIQPL